MPDEPQQIELPEPGIYPDVSDAVYRKWPFIHKSRLSTVWKKTLAHYKWELDNPEIVQTEAMKFGRFVHMTVLQPSLVKSHWVSHPEGYLAPPRKKDAEAVRKPWNWNGTACKQWREERKAEGLEIVTPAQWDKAIAMATAVSEHKVASRLIGGAQTEVPFVWCDPTTGLMCKGLADAVKGFIVEYKTVLCANVNPFGRQCYNLGWHIDGAFYFDGFTAASDKPVKGFIFIAQEKHPPYLIKCYELRDPALDMGRTAYKNTLMMVKAAMESNEWPGYGDEASDVMLPPWAEQELQG